MDKYYNFFHAIWRDKIPDRERLIRILKKLMKRICERDISDLILQDIKTTNTAEIYISESQTLSGGIKVTSPSRDNPKAFPYFICAIGDDNLVCVSVEHHNDDIDRPRPLYIPPLTIKTRTRLLSRFDMLVGTFKPDEVIRGEHDCSMNCSCCCDDITNRQYCEYFVYEGGYCLPVLIGAERPGGLKSLCSGWYCESFCNIWDAKDYPVGERPRISNPVSFTQKGKEQLLNALEMNRERADLETIASTFDRYHEVKTFKEAEKGLSDLMLEYRGDGEPDYALITGINCGDIPLIINGMRKLGIEEEAEPYLAKLREWQEMYNKRMGKTNV